MSTRLRRFWPFTLGFCGGQLIPWPDGAHYHSAFMSFTLAILIRLLLIDRRHLAARSEVYRRWLLFRARRRLT